MPASMTNYLEVIIIICNTEPWEGIQMLAYNLPQFCSYSESINSQNVDWIAKFPTTLDIFFTGLANTTSVYIGVERGGC